MRSRSTEPSGWTDSARPEITSPPAETSSEVLRDDSWFGRYVAVRGTRCVGCGRGLLRARASDFSLCGASPVAAATALAACCGAPDLRVRRRRLRRGCSPPVASVDCVESCACGLFCLSCCSCGARWSLAAPESCGRRPRRRRRRLRCPSRVSGTPELPSADCRVGCGRSWSFIPFIVSCVMPSRRQACG